MVSSTVLRAAAKAAEESDLRSSKHGAVLYRGQRKILAVACNKRRTHPHFGSGWGSFLHSEGAVLQKAQSMGINLKGLRIYVHRSTGGLSKPCPDCQKLLEEAGITHITFS